MVWASRQRSGCKASAGAFLRDRLTRIVPLYWLLTGVQIAFLAWAGSRGDANAASSLSLTAAFKSLFFVPYLNFADKHRPLLEAGWTLDYEMFFYLVFSASLLLSRAWGMLLAIGLLLAMFVYGVMFGPGTSGLAILATGDLLNFCAGMLLGWLWLAWGREGGHAPRVLPGQTVVLAGLVLFAATVLAHLNPFPGWKTLAAALLVGVAVFCVDRRESTFDKLLGTLGSASYSIYLAHGFWLLLVGMAWRKLWGGAHLHVYMGVCVLGALAFGWLCWRFVESPLTRWVRRCV